MTISDAREEVAPLVSAARVAALRDLNSPGEPDIFREVATLFVDDLPARLVALRSASAAADVTGILNSAHSLKGSARNVGADRLAVLMEQFEACAREKRLGDLVPLLGRLQGVSDATADALKQA
jgi:HPt (histidine-containing phosphotransfer) domain-containing protein